MSRDIFTVIEQMIECIPKDDPSSRPFLDALNKHFDNLSFVPPEQIYDVLQFNRVITPLDIHYVVKRRPQSVGIFECCIGNVTLRPIICLLPKARSACVSRINISAKGRNMISKSVI